MLDDDDDFDGDEDEEESEPLLLQMNEDGTVGFAPEMISITEEDFEKLNKGLLLLKEKYPEISKECFPE